MYENTYIPSNDLGSVDPGQVVVIVCVCETWTTLEGDDDEEEGEEEEEWITEEEEEEEEAKETEEVEEEPDTVRELLSTHSVWLRM